MKEELGRSPDKADMISMRMWWLIRNDYNQPREYNEDIHIKTDTQLTDEAFEKFLEGFD